VTKLLPILSKLGQSGDTVGLHQRSLHELNRLAARKCPQEQLGRLRVPSNA
jgi:hypothetical protein